MRTMSKEWKTALITAVCLLLVAALLIGLLWYFAGQTEPVGVSPVTNHMMQYWGEQAEFSGMVSTDGLQSVYLSDTQSVLEVYVKEGQAVERGDALFRYDTTLTDIQVSRKKLEVQQAELNLKTAKEELAEIKKMKPYTPPPSTRPTTQPTTAQLEPVDEMPYFISGEGTWSEPYRFLWQDELSFDEAFLLEYIEEEGTFYFAFEVREKDALAGELISLWGLQVNAVEQEDARTEIPDGESEPSEEPTEEPTEESSEEPTEPSSESTVPTLPTEPEKEYSLSYRFYEPEEIEHVQTPTVQTTPTTEWIDTSSGYTAAEIAFMKQEKELEIRDLDLAHRMLKVEYEKMKKEADGGYVFASIDGTVTNLLDPQTATDSGQPLMLISQGGSYHVTITLGEYDLDDYRIGEMATITSWMNYGYEVTGVLTAISDEPSDGYYSGMGNPDVSLYEAVIVVQADALLEENEWVTVQFSQNETNRNASFYLENAYIREENGRHYVYRRSADGRLEKSYVEVGASMDGFTAIISGLTQEDWIAFPYGGDVTDGAQTYEETTAVDPGYVTYG